VSREPAEAAKPERRTRDALVTVVIPAFNRASTIGAAIRSVQAQTCQDWEAVVVDDGSRDDTARTVERCAIDDGRIRLIRHAETLGAQAARNTGIRHARGRWIAFLDSDDRWVPSSLDLRLEAAATHHVSVVHSDAYQTRDDGSTVLFGVPAVEGWAYRDLLCRPGPMFQGLLVAREALEAMGGLDEHIIALQEWDTAIRLAECYRFGFVPVPTFVWDRRGDDTITKDRRRDARGYEQVVRKHVLAIRQYAGPHALSHHYAILAVKYHEAGDRSEAFRCLRSSRHFGRRGLDDDA
jgi:glycosyltransferase involved in cell wall biosynthesis